MTMQAVRLPEARSHPRLRGRVRVGAADSPEHATHLTETPPHPTLSPKVGGEGFRQARAK